jgi:hypothetical protein
MGAMYIRGGIPTLLSGSAPGVASVPARFRFSGGVTNHVIIQNQDETTDMVLFLTEAEATAGVGLVIPAKPGSCGNPLAMPAEMSSFWVRSAGVGAINFVALGFLRRG